MPTTDQCWECRKRRLICDFERPSCKKCHIRGVTCPGYDHKPLRWIEPGETRSKKRKIDKRFNDKLPVISKVHLEDNGATALVQAIEYYNNAICPDLVVTGRYGHQNPFFVVPTFAAYIRPAVAEMVVSTALGHRILQGVNRSGSDRGVLATKLQHHRGAAIRLMAEDLTRDAMQTSNEILVCVLVFLLAEIQQSISSNWRQHVDAAVAIVNARGGLGALVLNRGPFCHLLRYFTMVPFPPVTSIDILGATTAPPLDISRACRQLELVPLLPAIFDDSLQTCVPCPPELLGHVASVNHLRARSGGTGINQDSDLISPALVILQQICSYSVQEWVDKTVLPSLLVDITGEIERSDGLESTEIKSRRWIWLALTSAFKSAIALYCVSTLFDNEFVFSLGECGELIGADHCGPFDRTFYKETLLNNLHAIASNRDEHLRKFTIWPLAILGTQTETTDEASKRFVTSELKWISEAVGTASPLIAIEVLNKMWRGSSSSGPDASPPSWDGIFKQPYIFAV